MLVRRASLSLGLLALALLVHVPAVRAQAGNDTHRDSRDPRDSTEARERAVRRQRQGAGLRMGSWRTTGLSRVSGASYSSLPAFEGYWQRGLDRHLAIESSVGLWQRTQRASSGSGSESIGSYVLPLMTAIKLYPATTASDALEPFIMAGAGFTIGVDDRNTVSGGLLGGGSGGTYMTAGVGLKGAAGIEYHLGSAFGVQLSAGYQFIKFFEDVGSDRTYKGLQLMGGLTYRFQY